MFIIINYWKLFSISNKSNLTSFSNKLVTQPAGVFNEQQVIKKKTEKKIEKTKKEIERKKEKKSQRKKQRKKQRKRERKK